MDDIPYRKSGALYHGDKLIEHVPRLAICINLGEDIGPLLFHCNEEWNVLGASGADTIDATKLLAEKNYPGAMSRWVDTNTTAEEALRYYDAQAEGPTKCSFCGRRDFEVEGWVEGNQAAICKRCVYEYHDAFQNSGADSSDATAG